MIQQSDTKRDDNTRKDCAAGQQIIFDSKWLSFVIKINVEEGCASI